MSEECVHCGQGIVGNIVHGFRSEDDYDFLACCSKECEDGLREFYAQESAAQAKKDAANDVEEKARNSRIRLMSRRQFKKAVYQHGRRIMGNSLDRLVQSVTAFTSWNEMVASMKRGYVPTLNGGKAHAKLAGVVRRNGFRAYRCGILV